MNVRISILQNQLEARKAESFKLKKEQKKLRLENLKTLKAKEQDLLKQIDLYDKQIEESKKSLIVEIERKSIQLKKYSTKLESSKYLNKNDCTSEKNNHQNLHELDRKSWTDEKQYLYPIAIEELNNSDISQENLSHKLQQTNVIKPEQNFNEVDNNCDPVQSNYYEHRNHSSEKNDCFNIVSLHKESIETEAKTLKESSEIETKVNNVFLKSHSVEEPIYTSDDQEGNLKKIKTRSSEINEIDVIHLEEPLCNNFIPNQKILSINSNNQEFYFGEKINIGTSTMSNGSKSDDHTITSTSISSNIQRKSFINSNEDGNNLCEKIENNINQLELLNSEYEVDDTYSTDFVSDDNTSKFQETYFNKNDNNMIEFLDEEQSITSYEEERSEGDVVFEDKTFIEQYSNNNNVVSKNYVIYK